MAHLLISSFLVASMLSPFNVLYRWLGQNQKWTFPKDKQPFLILEKGSLNSGWGWDMVTHINNVASVQVSQKKR